MTLALLVALMVAQSGFVPVDGRRTLCRGSARENCPRGRRSRSRARQSLRVRQSVLPLDPVQAAEWYRRAADKGHAGAQMNLAMMYLDGQGVPRDVAQAVEWYEKAADRGDTMASFSLGSIYEAGADRVLARRCQSRDRGIGRPPNRDSEVRSIVLGLMYRDGRGTDPRRGTSHRLASQGGRSGGSRCPDRARASCSVLATARRPTSSRRIRGSTWRPRAGKTKPSA